MKLFAKKPIAVLLKQASEENEYSLKRGLGPFNLTLLGVGVIIGAGIFVLTGQAAATHAGPGIVISFLIAGFVCALAALCYAELASMIPVSGSAYTYTFATLGELFAWIIAWDLIVEYLFAAATVAVGWSGYFVGFMDSLFAVHIPDIWSKAPFAVEHGHQLIATGAVLNVPAMAIIALTAFVLILGITQSAAFNNVIVAIKVGIILIVIGVGIVYVRPELWTPLIPDPVVDPSTGASRYGFSGVFSAAGIIFFAYIGFEALSTAAQETRNPQRDMPIGSLGSLAICTVLYILMSLVMTGLAPYTELNVPAPVYVAVSALPPAFDWLPKAVTAAATIGLAATVMGLLYGQSRIFYAMSRDGLLPPLFSKVHPKRRTPWAGTLITALFAGLMAGLFPIGILGELVSVGTLLAFAMICAGVLYLRVAHPELPRSFRTPLVWVTAPLGVVSSLYLIASLPAATFDRLVIWMVIGIVVYATYAYWHSRYHERKTAPEGEKSPAS
jgi:APA family basic amino acid/polyamine antiporter